MKRYWIEYTNNTQQIINLPGDLEVEFDKEHQIVTIYDIEYKNMVAFFSKVRCFFPENMLVEG
jgi:hypothetical protein